MQEIIKFLTDNKVFFLATVDADQPRVRAMGFVMEFEDRLCFCTSNKKDMYKQMKANPRVEFCCAAADGTMLRITGNAVFNSTTAAKKKALDTMPVLRNMYSEDDAIFEIFYLENASAVFQTMKGEKRIIKL